MMEGDVDDDVIIASGFVIILCNYLNCLTI